MPSENLEQTEQIQRPNFSRIAWKTPSFSELLPLNEGNAELQTTQICTEITSSKQRHPSWPPILCISAHSLQWTALPQSEIRNLGIPGWEKPSPNRIAPRRHKFLGCLESGTSLLKQRLHQSHQSPDSAKAGSYWCMKVPKGSHNIPIWLGTRWYKYNSVYASCSILLLPIGISSIARSPWKYLLERQANLLGSVWYNLLGVY